MKWSWLYQVVRVALGALFIYAAAGKILQPAEFAREVDNYRLLPYGAVVLTAVVLPWLELFCGVGLIVHRWARGSALLVAIMLGVFTAALVSALARGLDISCGCFALSGEASKVSLLRVLEDCVMVAAAVWIWWKEEANQVRARTAT
ncbi:MAG: MauE/DoxX family redox-associated membrane protein [Candidatus Oleimicrobiaceae bacterium]